MMLSRTVAKYIPQGKSVMYELLQNEVVAMGPTRVHSYSICKSYNEKNLHWVVRGVKSKEAVDLIWADVVRGIQK